MYCSLFYVTSNKKKKLGQRKQHSFITVYTRHEMNECFSFKEVKIMIKKSNALNGIQVYIGIAIIYDALFN